MQRTAAPSRGPKTETITAAERIGTNAAAGAWVMSQAAPETSVVRNEIAYPAVIMLAVSEAAAGTGFAPGRAAPPP